MANATEQIQGSMFEALFERRLKPTGAFLEALKRAGYDMAQPRPEYDAEVFERCLEVAREFAFAKYPRREGVFRIGMELADGYLEDTLAGKVVAVALPLVGPDRLIKTLPRRLRTGTSNGDAQVDQLGERRWRVTFREVIPFPDFVAGAIQQTLARTNVNARVTVSYEVKDRTELLAEWDAKP